MQINSQNLKERPSSNRPTHSCLDPTPFDHRILFTSRRYTEKPLSFTKKDLKMMPCIGDILMGKKGKAIRESSKERSSLSKSGLINRSSYTPGGEKMMTERSTVGTIQGLDKLLKESKDFQKRPPFKLALNEIGTNQNFLHMKSIPSPREMSSIPGGLTDPMISPRVEQQKVMYHSARKPIKGPQKNQDYFLPKRAFNRNLKATKDKLQDKLKVSDLSGLAALAETSNIGKISRTGGITTQRSALQSSYRSRSRNQVSRDANTSVHSSDMNPARRAHLLASLDPLLSKYLDRFAETSQFRNIFIDVDCLKETVQKGDFFSLALDLLKFCNHSKPAKKVPEIPEKKRKFTKGKFGHR